MNAIDWIFKNTDADLEIAKVGRLDTKSGKIAILDPLYFAQPFSDVAIEVPTTGGDVVVFHDRVEGRNSKLAIVFSDAAVTSGADCATCLVEAGMGSVFTQESYNAMDAFLDVLGPTKNLYNDYFCKFDDDAGGERKMANLPDGTPIPYVHAGWGDGAYPVFSLLDADKALCAVYSDFMGCNENGDWLTPPGVKLTE